MTAFLVKACRRGVPCVLLSSLSRPSSCRRHNYGFLSFTPSSPSHFDSCRGPGRGPATHSHHTGSLGWRSLPQLRFYSVRGGGGEGKKWSNKEADDEEELSAEDDGDEDGNESGDGDDGVQLVSEIPAPLPVFKDNTEEAAYIGYKIVGSIKAGDFDRFKAPKAFAVVQLSFEKVLLLGSKSQTIIGRPFVPKAFVHAAVEEQVLDAKVIIFKKKRRKNYRRTTGHRQELTRLRILEIWGLGEARSAVA